MSKRSSTLLAAAGAAFVLVLGVRPGAAQVPAELVDDDDAAECPAATHATIQAAVDAVPSGGDANITVCAGAYDELVAISGKGAVRLTGVGDPVLTPPGLTGDGRLIDEHADDHRAELGLRVAREGGLRRRGRRDRSAARRQPHRPEHDRRVRVPVHRPGHEHEHTAGVLAVIAGRQSGAVVE